MTIKLVTADDLRRFRKILGLTQKGLAQKAGVSQSLIARIEKKTIDPRLSTIKKILDALTLFKDKRTAADIMHSPVITVNVTDTIKTAVELMKKHNISQMPILRENKIVGGIRETTIIDSIIKSGNSEKIFSGTVNALMENKFATVDLATPIDDVVYLLSQGEPAILVTNTDKLVGIITKIDVISSAINIQKPDES